MNKKVLIMAGGTGGHIFPGLALANQLQALGWSVLWLGTADRMEAKIVPEAGFDIRYIDVAGVRGNGLKRLLMAPFKIAKSILQGIAVIRGYQPDLVVGMGGFASGPGGVAAKLMGVPLVIHEQNAVAGMTNKVLAKLSNRVLMGFEGAFADYPANAKFQYVGNPVRSEFFQGTAALEKNLQDINVLVVGGSLGARSLNQHLPAVFAEHQGLALNIRHQCGQADLGLVTELYKKLHVESVEVHPFISDMVDAFSWADIVICRSGALTVAEIAAVGVAAIFIPLPYAVDDHQTENAKMVTQAGGGIIISQNALERGELLSQFSELINRPQQLLEMGRCSAAVASPDALNNVVSVCLSVVEEKS